MCIGNLVRTTQVLYDAPETYMRVCSRDYGEL
ncbi:MAG: hypothetical protein BWY45_01496 [Euryarchaeota archaeon ADurb.Bin294]|nr:MAG: hypothetical protein BWY45_01496 [Euryarchaeota archaeon ADurb.Bin294]